MVNHYKKRLEPNINLNNQELLYKHKYQLLGIVYTSFENFTIVSIERKSNLLRIYMNQQTKHQYQALGIVYTKLWRFYYC